MTRLYNFDDVVTAMKKDLDQQKACLEAWKRVEFPTKKNGEPFAVFSKNIKGASVKAEDFAMQPGEIELYVCAHSSLSGYFTDTIKLHDQVRYLEDPDMIAKTQNYMTKQSMLNQIYKYDLADTKKAVTKRIAYLEDYVAQLENQIAEARKVWDQFVKDYSTAMHGLQDATKNWTHKDLFYYVRDTVKARYPYV